MVYKYLRYSTELQEVASQDKQISDYCKELNLRVDKTIKDEGISGYGTFDRRDIKKLLEGMKSGDTIIVSEISRLTRDGAEGFVDMVKTYFRPKKIRLLICEYRMDIDYSKDIDGMVELMLFWFANGAKAERTRISRRTKAALAVKMASGVKIGRQSPKYGTGENYLINHAAGRIKCSETFVNKRLNNTETQTIIEAIAVAVPTIKEFDVEGSEYPFLGWWRASNLTKEQWARVVELIKYAETRSATPLIEKEDWTLVDIKARFKYLFGTRFRPMAEKIYNYGEPITPQKND